MAAKNVNIGRTALFQSGRWVKKEVMANIKAKSVFDPNAPEIVLKSLFLKYDKDGSGQLSKSELSVLFQDDLGFNKEQSEAYALLLDKDGNAQVSFQEFNSWLKSGEKFKNIEDKARYHKLRKAVELFNKYDLDKSQALDREEFKKLFKEVGGKPKNLDKALAELDRDGNNIISFQEFLRWLNWIPLDDF